MYKEIKFLSFNKYTDWEKGVTANLYVDNNGNLTLKDPFMGKGIFISKAMDSMENDNEWHRILMDCQILENSLIKLSCFALNTKSIVIGTRFLDIDEYLENNDIDIYTRANSLLSAMEPIVFQNTGDVLIHKAIGRYLYVILEIVGSSYVSNMRVYFTKSSFTQYLPEIYQPAKYEDSFIVRYIGIFESLYLDMEEKIDKTSVNFDTDTTKEGFLEWLVTWVDIDNPDIWEKEKLRYLLKNAVSIYKKKGTRKGIEEIVRLYTGKIPYIVEAADTRKATGSEEQQKLMAGLYGDNPCIFTVILDHSCVLTEKEYTELEKILESFKPAHTLGRIVLLKPYIGLDTHSYLEINSYIMQHGALVLDNLSELTILMLESPEPKITL